MREFHLTEPELIDIVRRTTLAVVAELGNNLRTTPEIMTKARVAQYLGRSVATVDRWMLKGLPYQKQGKEHPTFIKRDVDNWLRSRN